MQCALECDGKIIYRLMYIEKYDMDNFRLCINHCNEKRVIFTRYYLSYLLANGVQQPQNFDLQSRLSRQDYNVVEGLNLLSLV